MLYPSLDEAVLGELHSKSLESREATATVYRDAKQGKWKVLALVPMNHFSWSIGVGLDYTEFNFLSRALLFKTMVFLAGSYCHPYPGFVLYYQDDYQANHEPDGGNLPC